LLIIVSFVFLFSRPSSAKWQEMHVAVYKTLSRFPCAYNPKQRGYIFGTGKVVIFISKAITDADIRTVEALPSAPPVPEELPQA
jgi:hypothetical protein